MNVSTTTRRQLLGYSGAGAATLALTACSAGSTSSSGGGQSGDGVPTTVVVGLTGTPVNMDFTTTSGAAIPQVAMNNLYEGLVTIDQDGEVQPQLATAWTVSDDRLVYDFTLNEGVTFSNGEPFTANDVAFSIQRVQTDWTLSLARKFDIVASVEPVSDLQARITLSRPSNSFIYDLGSSIGMMFTPTGVADLATTPVGTGPFTMESFVQGDRIELVTRDDYWGETPAVTAVTLRYFADVIASTNALRSGDVDALYSMQAPDLVAQFEADDAFAVEIGTTTGEVLLSMNNSVAPFDDVRVRQAVAHAIDRQAVLDTAWAGYGTLIGGPVPPTDPYYEDLNDVYAYDPEQARALLAEAGYPSVDVVIDVPTRPYATACSEIVVSQLAAVGINATIQSAEFPAVWLDKVFTRADYQLTIIMATESRDVLAIFNNPDYYIRYDNSTIAPIAEAADAGTPEEYVEGMQEVVRTIVDDAASLPLFLFPNIVVTKAGLQGVPPNSVTESLVLSGLSWTQ